MRQRYGAALQQAIKLSYGGPANTGPPINQFTSVTGSTEASVSNNFDLTFPACQGGELIIVGAWSVRAGGAPPAPTIQVGGASLRAVTTSIGGGLTGGSGLGTGIFGIAKANAGDTRAHIATTGSDSTVYVGAIAIVVNNKTATRYTGVATATVTNTGAGKPQTDSVTYPAGGLGTCFSIARASGATPSGTAPSFTSPTDIVTPLLFGPATQWGIALAVSLTQSSFTMTAGAPANAFIDAVASFAHL